MALVFESAVKFLPRIDRMAPRRLDSALFGMGRSFDSEPRFGLTKGVWRTAVGYSGGRYGNPSCEDLRDHLEVVMVEYDPLALSYGQLLDIFLNWRCGELSQRASFQNVPSVFVKNEFEKRMAQAAAARYGFDACGGDGVRVTMSKTFYKAEKWCQKHFLRMFPALMDEVRPLYADEDDLIQSTLATRLNGILGQQAQKEFSVSYVPEDFEFYDLSDYAVHILRSVMPQNCIA